MHLLLKLKQQCSAVCWGQERSQRETRKCVKQERSAGRNFQSGTIACFRELLIDVQFKPHCYSWIPIVIPESPLLFSNLYYYSQIPIIIPKSLLFQLSSTLPGSSVFTSLSLYLGVYLSKKLAIHFRRIEAIILTMPLPNPHCDLFWVFEKVIHIWQNAWSLLCT